MQQRQQAAAFHAVAGHGHAQGLQDGGYHVHAFDEAIVHTAACGIGLASRVGHDEGHALHGIEELLLLAQPVVTQKVAVVGAENHQGVVQTAHARHLVEQAPEVVVQLLDEALVGRAHVAHHLVTRKGGTFLMLPVGRQHRVGVVQFRGALDRGQAMLVAVHRVVRRGRHVGPVRLHVAQVQHPRAAALAAHEVDGLVSHVGRLGVALLNAGGQVHVPHMPAADHLAALVDGGDDVVAPGVGAVVALGAQPGAVAVGISGLVVAVMAVHFVEAPA